jgi:hypothetical protein
VLKKLLGKQQKQPTAVPVWVLHRQAASCLTLSFVGVFLYSVAKVLISPDTPDMVLLLCLVRFQDLHRLAPQRVFPTI